MAASIVGKERNAAARLDSRFEIFLPIQQVPRYTYLGKFKDFYPRALFPGYFFVHCEPELRPLKHCEYRGLVGFGGAGVGEPLPMHPMAIDELRAIADKEGTIRLPELTPGVAVEIQEKGHYWGKRGLYLCKSGEDRVIILLDSLTKFEVKVLRSAVKLVEVQ